MRWGVFERFNREIWIITSTELISTMSFSICLPFFSLYLYLDRGIPMTLVGLVILFTGLSAAVTKVVGGELSDRYGRRLLLIYISIVRILMYSMMAVLIAISAPVWIIACVYIAGQSVGAMKHPIISATIAELSPADRLTETYGLLRIGRNVGWAAGPAAGGFLASVLPYSWLFGFAALMATLAFYLILVFYPESSPSSMDRVSFRSSIFAVYGDWKFISFASLNLLVFLVMGQLVSTLSIFTIDRLSFSTEQFGLLLTMNGAIVILFQYPVARKISRLKRSTALITGSLFYSAGFLSLGWFGSFFWVLVSIVVVTIGEIIFSPTSTSLGAELSPPERRGYYMGFLGLSETTGIAFGPLVGGILLDIFPHQPFMMWGIIASIPFIASVGFYRWDRVFGGIAPITPEKKASIPKI